MSKYTSTVLAILLGLVLSDCAYAKEYKPINAVTKGAIYDAAVHNRQDLLQKYLELRYNIDAVDGYGMTALCSALENGEHRAYQLLVHYGANPQHRCVQQVQENRAVNQKAKNTKMWWTTGIAGGGAALAVAMASGGGGGGGGNSGDSGNTPGGGGDDSGDDDKPKDFNPYSPEYFNGDAEYTGSYFGADAVNYLSSINATQAFSTAYGTDKNGEFATNLSSVRVGVIDTGVWGNHSEFMLNGVSKVSGVNYDYGPCLNGDVKNCWQKVGEQFCDDGMCVQNVELLGTTQTGQLSCDGMFCNAYDEWKNNYPDDYDWDSLQDYFYPNAKGEDSLHGTHVTGIIVSNHNGKGNMGVVPLSTTVSAVRWDFISDLGYPLQYLREQNNILAVNMSLGLDASDDSHASMASTDLSDFDAVLLNEYKHLISDYSSPSRMDTIVVKAAGNENYHDADLWSGIKLNPEYSDLLMLVVMAVDVSFNEDMSVKKYTRSSFSNYCGSTSGYCLAAPGGTENIIGNKLIYSAGEAKEDYEGMGGTSQASAVVTGAIAFLKGKYNYLTSAQIVDLLLTTANKISADTYSEEIYGAGLLDLSAAVQYVSDSGGTITTVGGGSVSSPKVALTGSRLSLTANVQNALLRALPQSITVFDKYNRPYGIKTSNYISVNHSGYRTFKNDVINIAGRKPKTYEKDNIKLSFSGASLVDGKNKIGFASAEYKGEGTTNGFYFSDSTVYHTTDNLQKEMHNPFMSFNNAYSVYNISDINDDFALKTEIFMGQNGLYDGDKSFNDVSFKKSAYAFNTELQLHKSKNFAFGISSGLLYEDGAMLGTNGEGAFAVQNSGTYNAGVNASWFITPKITISGAYYRGYTHGQSFASNLLNTSALQSESFAFDANYKYDGNMDFGLKLSSPLRVVKGKLFVDFPSGRDNYSDTVYREQYAASLKSEAREYKLSAYLNRNISENISFSSEIGVRFNPEHQKANNDYRALFGLNWNF